MHSTQLITKVHAKHSIYLMAEKIKVKIIYCV